MRGKRNDMYRSVVHTVELVIGLRGEYEELFNPH